MGFDSPDTWFFNSVSVANAHRVCNEAIILSDIMYLVVGKLNTSSSSYHPVNHGLDILLVHTRYCIAHAQTLLPYSYIFNKTIRLLSGWKKEYNATNF